MVDLEALAGHTPEPWTMRGCPCKDPICRQYTVSPTRADGRYIEADARLIIAAPDLLAEVRELRARVVELNLPSAHEHIVAQLKARVAELGRHLDVMIGTHGEACVHYPCAALEAARKARTP